MCHHGGGGTAVSNLGAVAVEVSVGPYDRPAGGAAFTTALDVLRFGQTVVDLPRIVGASIHGSSADYAIARRMPPWHHWNAYSGGFLTIPAD